MVCIYIGWLIDCKNRFLKICPFNLFQGMQYCINSEGHTLDKININMISAYMISNIITLYNISPFNNYFLDPLTGLISNYICVENDLCNRLIQYVTNLAFANLSHIVVSAIRSQYEKFEIVESLKTRRNFRTEIYRIWFNVIKFHEIKRFDISKLEI